MPPELGNRLGVIVSRSKALIYIGADVQATHEGTWIRSENGTKDSREAKEGGRMGGAWWRGGVPGDGFRLGISLSGNRGKRGGQGRQTSTAPRTGGSKLGGGAGGPEFG